MNAVTQDLIYRPATRANVGLLIMLAGPSGSGKTLSALMLARGLAGANGKIAFADTEHGRALYYADAFQFAHLALDEPFRPSKFEAAAVAAQQQKADVWICDSFSHEHVGPGGMLDFFDSEIKRLAGDDYEKRERMKAAAWIKPKGEHKHMLQRLWQLNAHIILCCQAEKKVLLTKITEGPKKGKIDWVDIGFQPVCGADIPYAMTASFMFDVSAPGVPIVIKPMLEDMAPLIDLKQPITIATGERLAAWARGDRKSTSSTSKEAAKSEVTAAPPQQTASPGAAAPGPADPPPPDETGPPPNPPPPDVDERAGAVSPANHTTARDTRTASPPSGQSGGKPGKPDEATIAQGARDLAAKFGTTLERRDHFALVDDRDVQKQIQWLQKHRKDLFAEIVKPAVSKSWERTGKAAQATQANLLDQPDRQRQPARKA